MDALRRKLVVAEALTWVGTPYGHHQAAKGLAADCALFPVRVYQSLGLLGTIDIPEYSEQWFLHFSEERYVDKILSIGAIETDSLEPGNFTVWKIGRAYSHGAIIVDWPTVVHSLKPDGVMTANALTDGQLRHRPYKVFTL
jgi:cell wall-associated NlpC family hydrolase